MSTNKRSDIVGFHNIKNKVNRNAFDLSHRHMFTAQIGELLPVFTQWVNPNETFKIGYNGFTRTDSLQTAAFTRLRENIQYYFVPFSALWRYFEQQIINMPVGQSGENISKVASSATAASTITTSMPYLNYTFFSTLLFQLLEETSQYLAPLITSASVTSQDLIQKLRERSQAIYTTSGFVSRPLLQGETLRYVSIAKLLRALGYINTTIDTYDIVANMLAYAASKNQYPVVASQFRTDSTYGYTTYMNYLDIANAPNLSIFPLLAYHKICQDHYKYRQWQAFDPTICNIDYIQGDSAMNFSTYLGNLPWYNDLFCLEQSNVSLDYFNGVLPKAQYGDESAVSVDTRSNTVYFTSSASFDNTPTTTTKASVPNIASTLKVDANGKLYYSDSSGNPVLQNAHSHSINLDELSPTFKISALRSAVALQKYKEIQECNDSDFASQVLAHFGVKPHTDKRVSRFIGGGDSTISINPEVNQNLADGNDPTIKATGTSQLSAGCKFTSDTFGIIIGIYRCVPQLDFAKTGIDRQLLKTDASDFPMPEFDNLGMQSQYRFEVSAPSVVNQTKMVDDTSSMPHTIDMSETYGYLPRYAEYKTSYDRYEGAFLGSLSTWVTGYSDDALKLWRGIYHKTDMSVLSMDVFLQCSPRLTYPLFNNQQSLTVNDDKLLIGSVNTCVAVRPFSVYGLPYSK